MILTTKKPYVFHAWKEKPYDFVDEKGVRRVGISRIILVFPIDENGKVGDEQERIKVDEEQLSVFKRMKQGERCLLEIGGYIKDEKIYSIESAPSAEVDEDIFGG